MQLQITAHKENLIIHPHPMLHSRMRRFLPGVIIVCAVAIIMPLVALSQTTHPDASVLELNRQIQEKKSRISSIRGQISAFQNKIKQKQSEKATLENQISLIDDHITTTELDLEVSIQEIEQLSLEIDQANLEITEKERRITYGKERMSAVIRSLYEESQRNFLEILLMNDRFSDFFDSIHSLELVQSQLKDSVQEVKALHQQLLAQRASMEHARIRQEELKIALESKKEQMEDQKNTKQELILQSVLTAEKYQSLLQNARSEQQQIDADISHLERSVREKLRILGDRKAVLGWPIDPSRGITALFHDPSYPYRHIFEHPAIDIRAGQGSYVKSAEDGYVARVKFDGTKAYAYIMIVHPSGLATVYGHINRPLVQQDTYVKKGQVVALSGAMPGTVGAGPLTTGPHLHFEVRLNGIPVDPLKYLP